MNVNETNIQKNNKHLGRVHIPAAPIVGFMCICVKSRAGLGSTPHLLGDKSSRAVRISAMFTNINQHQSHQCGWFWWWKNDGSVIKMLSMMIEDDYKLMVDADCWWLVSPFPESLPSWSHWWWLTINPTDTHDIDTIALNELGLLLGVSALAMREN